MMAKKTEHKGFAAEEALRGYFRSTGHFVVRGIPLVYRKYDVTDVDLWLYVKASSLSAERTCVDVKRRRTPQAMERVLWTKGLKEVLGVDRAIVVTSDNRAETREFGNAHGVGILQGEFLKRVVDVYPPSDRLTEEELFSILRTPCVVDASLDWRAWYRRAKSTLLDRLNFDGCNSFLVRAKLLFDEYCATGGSEAATRLLYAVVAYLLICLDRTSRSCVSLDVKARASILTDGFRYGEAGHQRTEEVVQMALQLLSDAGKTDLCSGESLRDEFDRQVSEYRADILGEYFSKPDALKNLFSSARAFETLVYSKSFQRPNEIPNDQRALLGLICDFVGQDRKAII